MTLGEGLQRLRQEKGFSQEEVARRLFLSRQSVSKWENDQAEPGVEHLKALAKLYGVTVDELIGNAPAEEPQAPAGLLEGAAALRIALALIALFAFNDGLLHTLDLPVMLAAIRWRGRTLWLLTLILTGVSLFFNAVSAARNVWYHGIGTATVLPMLMVAALAVELAIFLHPGVKGHFCKEAAGE